MQNFSKCTTFHRNALQTFKNIGPLTYQEMYALWHTFPSKNWQVRGLIFFEFAVESSYSQTSSKQPPKMSILWEVVAYESFDPVGSNICFINLCNCRSLPPVLLFYSCEELTLKINTKP